VSEIRHLFEECTKEHGLRAWLEQLNERISHRQRVNFAIEWGKGRGEVQYHGMMALAISSLPRDQAMRVYGVRMEQQEYFDRWRWVWLEIRPGLQVRQSRLTGKVWVDRARLIFVDVDALGHWEHENSLDGKADFVFWGKDAHIAADKVGAPKITEGYGWLDLPIDDAVKRGLRTERVRKKGALKFATDFRPHSHHYLVMRQIRSAASESGVIEVGGAVMCAFMTSWGDGIFPVIADLDEEGLLVRLRIDLGNEGSVAVTDELIKKSEER